MSRSRDTDVLVLDTLVVQRYEVRRAVRLSCSPANRAWDIRGKPSKNDLCPPGHRPTMPAVAAGNVGTTSIAHLRTDSLAIAWAAAAIPKCRHRPGRPVWRESPSLGGFTQTDACRPVELANGFGPELPRTPVMDDGGSPSSSKHYSTLVAHSPAFARDGSSLAVTGDWNARPCEEPRAPGRAVRPLGSVPGDG